MMESMKITFLNGKQHIVNIDSFDEIVIWMDETDLGREFIRLDFKKNGTFIDKKLVIND